MHLRASGFEVDFEVEVGLRVDFGPEVVAAAAGQALAVSRLNLALFPARGGSSKSEA